jgi:hypothetical protein
MVKPKPGKKPNFPSNVDETVFIADVPVKITFMLGDETLQEYEDVIDLTFDTKTPAGRELGKRMGMLKMQDGHTTESALFKIASDELHTHATEMIQAAAHTDILKRTAGRQVHLHVKRNGDITYRMPIKDEAPALP